jgi:hypothetical protein
MKSYSERRELERKRKFSNNFAQFVRSRCEPIPAPTPADITGKYRGRVVHIMCAHDDWCPAWGTGNGCVCNPIITYYLQPLELPTEN